MTNRRPSQFDIPVLLVFLLCFFSISGKTQGQENPHGHSANWVPQTPLPNDLGVAGPFVGIHRDALIVAGGANFPKPVWSNDKQWLDQVYVLPSKKEGQQWITAGKIPKKLAYGCSVSTEAGLLCIGGNDSQKVYRDVFLLSWNPEKNSISTLPYPALPKPCAFGAAAVVGDTVYVAGGQSGQSLSSSMTNLWSLDLSKKDDPDQFHWVELEAWPGKSRAFNLLITQHNGFDDCLYVFSGRRQGNESDSGSDVEFLTDCWQYNIRKKEWSKKRDLPKCVMAGTGVPIGQSHVLVLSGADGTLFHTGGKLKDRHPGFPKRSWLYHSITDTWTPSTEIPSNQVTTQAVRWGNDIYLASGEIKPRVRTPKVWKIQVKGAKKEFGSVNYSVLILYLVGVVAVGLYFAKRNRTTDDYFRGGNRIPWWAAGCSIFATMLSSLTFTGIPAKSYAQDWVYAVGNFTIPLVAVVAVWVAMPFYRRMDATSAYEYLERRFHRWVRLFGSLMFSLFHLFRMAIVMSLTGLTLAVATPLSPTQAVLVMGLLSILYCTFGGIEAVIWTDTMQTIVLLGGAVFAFGFLVFGTDGGWTGLMDSAVASDKFRIANLQWDVTSSQIAFWVIVVGAIAQNTSSYTADQAVVQRYLTTKEPHLAARSIWTNAVLTIPATFLFFGLGTALFTFYQSHPERMDPTITTDQVFPLFIANELPIGLAGLIVAGVFAAAQSTVSTSMNSTATTLVTDFLRPFISGCKERTYLRIAQVATVALGIGGTLLALIFVDPGIKSLFDTFIKVIGLFMGVLGGLFVLGAFFRKPTATSAAVGIVTGMVAMVWAWQWTEINGYLFTAIGIGGCVLGGWCSSLLFQKDQKDLKNLTIHTME